MLTIKQDFNAISTCVGNEQALETDRKQRREIPACRMTLWDNARANGEFERRGEGFSVFIPELQLQRMLSCNFSRMH